MSEQRCWFGKFYFVRNQCIDWVCNRRRMNCCCEARRCPCMNAAKSDEWKWVKKSRENRADTPCGRRTSVVCLHIEQWQQPSAMPSLSQLFNSLVWGVLIIVMAKVAWRRVLFQTVLKDTINAQPSHHRINIAFNEQGLFSHVSCLVVSFIDPTDVSGIRSAMALSFRRVLMRTF